MMLLLHIIATPRATDSNTLRVSNAFLEGLQVQYSDLEVKTLNLFTEDLPSVAGQNIESKYTLIIGRTIDQNHAGSWKHIEGLIERFLAADLYLISVPMWNFSIPYALKYFIDSIIQPGYLFKYDEQGAPVGLCTGKKMVCITTRGGDYSPDSPMHTFDLQEPYLRSIFGFVGITDIEFVHAQPMDVSPELREAAIAAAIDAARGLAAQLSLWASRLCPEGRTAAPSVCSPVNLADSRV